MAICMTASMSSFVGPVPAWGEFEDGLLDWAEEDEGWESPGVEDEDARVAGRGRVCVCDEGGGDWAGVDEN